MTNEELLLQRIRHATRSGATELGFSHNKLTKLPPEIGQFTNLISLDFSHNQLSLRDLEEMGEAYFVPPGLRQRVSVKKLLDGIEPESSRRGGLGRESRREELQQLIWNYQRRLQKLKEEQALKGSSASLLVEIEDVEVELEQLQTELSTRQMVHR